MRPPGLEVDLQQLLVLGEVERFPAALGKELSRTLCGPTVGTLVAG